MTLQYHDKPPTPVTPAETEAESSVQAAFSETHHAVAAALPIL